MRNPFKRKSTTPDLRPVTSVPDFRSEDEVVSPWIPSDWFNEEYPEDPSSFDDDSYELFDGAVHVTIIEDGLSTEFAYPNLDAVAEAVTLYGHLYGNYGPVTFVVTKL